MKQRIWLHLSLIYNHNKDNKHILYRVAISLSYMSGKQKFKISYSPTDFIHIQFIVFFLLTRSQSWGSKAAFVSIFLPSRPSQVYHFFLIISPNLKTLEISFFLNWFCRLEPNLVFKSRNWLQSKIFQNKDYDMMKPCWIQNEKSSGLGLLEMILIRGN